MISPEYCATMARYNKWQNNGLRSLVEVMDDDALRLDRGAFFGSIWGTLNHLLWGDRTWMNRFDPALDAPETIEKGVGLTETTAEWSAERLRVDHVITKWALGIAACDLEGDLHWYSMLYKKAFTDSKALCVVHFFNHQTHHRGQIHAMMTGAGQTPIDTDLPFMPEN